MVACRRKNVERGQVVATILVSFLGQKSYPMNSFESQSDEVLTLPVLVGILGRRVRWGVHLSDSAVGSGFGKSLIYAVFQLSQAQMRRFAPLCLELVTLPFSKHVFQAWFRMCCLAFQASLQPSVEVLDGETVFRNSPFWASVQKVHTLPW